MSLRRLPKTSRISPIGTERKDTIDKEFEIIEKFFWITGIVFTRNRILCNIRGLLLITLDVALSLVYLYFTLATFYLVASRSVKHSTGYAIINAFANFSGICVRFVVLFKRRQIRKCIDTISKLDRDILASKDSISLKKYLYWGCAGAMFLPLVQMLLGALLNNTHSGHKRYEILYLFGIKAPKNFDIRAFVILMRVVNVVLCKSLPFLTVILCSYVFTRLRIINQYFLLRLKTSLEMDASSKLFNDYTVFYSRITKTVDQVEKSYSLVSFFLYGYILSCIFSVTSFLVTKPGLENTGQTSAIGFQLVTLAEIVACFIILSMRAAGVNESAVEVKNVIHTLPSKQFDYNPNLTATLLQLSNNFANEVCMTGWGLFVINRSFILTTAGVVVSYGVILVQLGK